MVKPALTIAVLVVGCASRKPAPVRVSSEPRERPRARVECETHRSPVADFERGVRSRATEAKLRPIIDKASVRYELECRDRVCRIRTENEADHGPISRAIGASPDRPVSAIFNMPDALYLQITDPAVAEFFRVLETKIAKDVKDACKRQHTERGIVELRLAVTDGVIVPTIKGDLSTTPMGECLRAGVAKLFDAIEVPPGALPHLVMLRVD